MQAPDSSHQSSQSSDGSPAGGKSPRRMVTVVGALVLLTGTVAAIMQEPRAEPLRDSSVTSLDWWRYPVESNAIQRLAVSRGPLNAVFAQRGTDEVWFAGEGGLVIHSTDAGRTWQSTNLDATPQAARAIAPEKAAMRSRRLSTPVSFVSATQARVQRPYTQSAPPTTVVPDVSGVAYLTALDMLGKSRLRSSVQYFSATRMPSDLVMSLPPAAGIRVPVNSVVQLTVSGVPPGVQRPPVIPTAPPNTARVSFFSSSQHGA